MGKETTETTQEEQTRTEAAMGITLQWLGHASFKICHADTVIYIDPWKLKDSPHDATVVLVSHSHYDHYSARDVARVSGPDTKLIASADVVAQEKAGEAITPGETKTSIRRQTTGSALSLRPAQSAFIMLAIRTLPRR